MEKILYYWIIFFIILAYYFKYLIESWYLNNEKVEKYSKIKYIEKLNNVKQNNAICFLTRNANKISIDFALECAQYNDTYIVVDDNTQIFDTIKNTSNFKIIQINNDECAQNEYTWSTWRFNQNVTAWDKAFYYFCEKETKYDNVWFMEDDVFIPRPDMLYNIDLKYGACDFISSKFKYISDDTNSQNKRWGAKILEAQKHMASPSIHWSLVCGMRCSKKLLEIVKNIKSKKNQLFFHEMFIPTIVKNYNLSYKTIPELANIKYEGTYSTEYMLTNNDGVYHPVKDYDLQYKLRNAIRNKLTNIM